MYNLNTLFSVPAVPLRTVTVRLAETSHWHALARRRRRRQRRPKLSTVLQCQRARRGGRPLGVPSRTLHCK